jgi:hypothetical protein
MTVGCRFSACSLPPRRGALLIFECRMVLSFFVLLLRHARDLMIPPNRLLGKTPAFLIGTSDPVHRNFTDGTDRNGIHNATIR